MRPNRRENQSIELRAVGQLALIIWKDLDILSDSILVVQAIIREKRPLKTDTPGIFQRKL